MYLNYIQIFVYALTAFIGALYLWLPEANQPSVQATIKIFGLPVLSNILLVINPILGIFGESTKRSCYYKVKFRLDFSAMLIWLAGICYFYAVWVGYSCSVGRSGKMDGFNIIVFSINLFETNADILKTEYRLFIAFYMLTIIEFFLLVFSFILDCRSKILLLQSR